MNDDKRLNQLLGVETRYNLLINKLSSIFAPVSSNICLMCKHHKISGEAEKLGCNNSNGKCQFDPDEAKL